MHPRVVGIYSMVTMNHHATEIARALQDEVELLVVGGPLPSLVPDSFLDLFDVVVLNEGEETFLELVRRHLDGRPWYGLQGTAHRTISGEVTINQRRGLIKDLDGLPFPARDMFPNDSYKRYWRRYHGYTATSEMSTRGCPYACDFCSSPVFGRSYRERSPENVCSEMADIQSLGYDRVFFTDDCFTLNATRVEQICAILSHENLDLEWMCLSRVDTLTRGLAKRMADAGCVRVFFGIEAGNDRMLHVMNKRTDLSRVREAVEAAGRAGIETGGFFILGYPGETNASLLETLRFSSSLRLDYLSYSFPYPIVGTGLYRKVEKRITRPEWRKQRGKAGRHQLLFAADHSSFKLTFARYKGEAQHLLRKRGQIGSATASVFEKLTDRLIPILK
jgi:anaerobic magnesium-protoporphyrin IX monomethyl ester cyclase